MSLRTGNYCGFTIAGHEHGIVTIAFNRPESLNASTAPMKRDLVEALTQIQMDDLAKEKVSKYTLVFFIYVLYPSSHIIPLNPISSIG